MCVTYAWVCQHCISVWDPFTANSIKALEKVQRWAARWVKQDYRKSACVDTIRGRLQWPTVGKTSPPQHFVQVPQWSPPHQPTQGLPPNMPMTSPMTDDITIYSSPDSIRYRQKMFSRRTIPEFNSLLPKVTIAPIHGSLRLGSVLFQICNV